MAAEGSSGMRDCHLASARGLIRVAGELVAIPHHIEKTGYKAKNSYGAKAVFSGETTNRFFQKSVKTVGEGQCIKTATVKKKLMPYSVKASRNRPKETMENTVGTRFDIHPSIKHEEYRGSSRVKLQGATPDANSGWKTTNQVFAECTQIHDTVGLANPGISSDVAKRMHKKQGIYV
ncbi:hypothetical protein BSKO_04266 [Bryopsis sp. KO-2023]|nr:hypothetical protein BSKO_04266 [Bryopsis sp. KO-2023]